MVTLKNATYKFVIILASLLLLAMQPRLALANDLKGQVKSVTLGKNWRSATNRQDYEPSQVLNLRGWNYLAARMIAAGVERQRIYDIFGDERLPEREFVEFKVAPQESKAIYKYHNTKQARKNALQFYKLHRDYFRKAEKRYSVLQSVILAILQVESQTGKVTGEHSVFYRLARLAAMADPLNVQDNIRRYRKIDPKVSAEAITARAQWLEQTFLPHSIATVALADAIGLHPLEIKGSVAGALGIPQFLPGNVFKHGIDGDGDKIVDLYNPADAILSVGKFLSDHGWNKQTNTWLAKSSVLLHYNRSQPYVDTVLTMAGQLAVDTK